jgi:MerR family transcriptional regulator/heat shock protein HspR
MAKNRNDKEAARTFLISVAAELAGMHAQTLRTYDRLGLVSPSRSSGGGRRYSQHDVELLREVQRLSQDEGVNLAGIKRIIELTNQVDVTSRWCPKAPPWWSGSRGGNERGHGCGVRSPLPVFR